MEPLKVGIVGTGVIGKVHLRALAACEGLHVVGSADIAANARETSVRDFGVPAYPDHVTLMQEAQPDYVVICTPHYAHAGIAIDAMALGAHVYIEKPMTVHADRAHQVLAAAKRHDRKVAVGFGRRLRPAERKFKEMIDAGFLGQILRASIVLTKWFRSQHYYNSATWRGTWDGEGGGVIVNQAPHDLDLICWTLGLPEAVCADIDARGHDIEVEDDLCAMLKWTNGAKAALQINTNEAPGRSFFEVTGTRGTLTLDSGRLIATRMGGDTREFSDTTKEAMQAPQPLDTVTYELPDGENRYAAMHRDFARAIQENRQPVCSGEEGLAEVELANALLLSGIRRSWVTTPVNAGEFNSTLAALVASKSMAATRADLLSPRD